MTERFDRSVILFLCCFQSSCSFESLSFFRRYSGQPAEQRFIQLTPGILFLLQLVPAAHLSAYFSIFPALAAGTRIINHWELRLRYPYTPIENSSVLAAPVAAVRYRSAPPSQAPADMYNPTNPSRINVANRCFTACPPVSGTSPRARHPSDLWHCNN